MSRPVRDHVSTSSLVLMGVPKNLAGYTIEDFRTFGRKGLLNVRSFVEEYIRELDLNIESGKGIFFCGSNGVGKTMLSCIILKEAYRRRYSCRRVSFSQYKDEYTASWGIKDGSERSAVEQEFYEKYMGAEVLVLEEVGKEIDSSIAKPVLETLLRYRDEHSLPTIICTNMAPQDFKEFYGGSIASLVNGSCTVVKIASIDVRCL